jgi:TonB C terminal
MIALFVGAAMLVADTNHFSACPTLPPTRDSTTRTLYAVVSDPFTGLAMPMGFTGLVAEAVRTKLVLPPNMPPVVFDPHGWPTIVTTTAFSLTPNGTVRNVAMMSSSSSLAIDSLVIRAIEAAARDSSYPPLPPRAGNGIRLAIAVSPDSMAGAVPLLTLRLPVWNDFATATMLKNPTRAHGPNTPLRGETDTLVVNFVVDDKGVPLMGTVNVARSPGTAFTRSYLDWLKVGRFTPAHIQRCAVRGLVHLKGTLNVQDGFIPAF